MDRHVRALFRMAIFLAAAFPLAVWAGAGSVLFVYGNAYIEAPDGQRTELVKGSVVNSGDTLVTTANGRLQLRMADGGLLALKPQTRFQIEDFNYPSGVAGTADSTAATGESRSFFVLLKGGFRSITGTIGKQDKSAYRVRTPIATIGIRGTDYTALYCDSDCGKAVRDGLYVGVDDGGIRVTTDAGSVDLSVGEFGYAADANTSPVRSEAAAEILARATKNRAATSASASNDGDSGSVEEDDAGQVTVNTRATDDKGNTVDLTDGTTNGRADVSGALGFSAAGATGAAPSATADAQYDAAGQLQGFTVVTDNVESIFSRNSAAAVNGGRDDDRDGATGMSWGRWSGGAATVTRDGVQQDLPLENSSLHWISAAEGSPTPEVPTTGSASFELIGNTNPTDNAGNVGTLGSANLSADFTAQTVDADVSLSFDQTNQVWQAAARDVDINSADATFDGAFDDVTVSDLNTGDAVDGEGDLSGFFTGDENGVLNGAGMSYSLSDGSDTEVSGTTAFQSDVDN